MWNAWLSSSERLRREGHAASRAAEARRRRPWRAVQRWRKSLARALSILVALAESYEGLTLAVLSKRLGLPPSTAHRLLTTLQRQRFVRFDSASMSWRIGVQAFTVGSAFAQSSDVVALAKPYMRRLMEQTGETINLYVLSGEGAICMAQVQSPQMIRAISRPGGALGMHRSAAGKAMLAHMPKDQVADIVMKHGLPRSTQNTIGSMRKLEVGACQDARSRVCN